MLKIDIFVYNNKMFIKFCLLCVSLCVCVPSYGITIGDYKALGSDRGVILLTQLDGADYLDVSVEVSGVPTNYVLEQVSADVVLIRLTDERLKADSALISVKVESSTSSAKRLYSHSTQSTSEDYFLSTSEEAKQIEQVKQQETQEQSSKLIIPATNIVQNQTDDQLEEADYKYNHGVLHINIDLGVTTIGKALFELARAQNYNVLVLPGDDVVLNHTLVASVSSFEDLYHASDEKVKHVFIDDERRLVRVVDESFDSFENKNALYLAGEDEILEAGEQSNTIATTTIGILVERYALSNGLELLSLPGDEKVLNQSVKDVPIADKNDLAEFANTMSFLVDIDEGYGLMRVRSNNVQQ